MNEFRKEFEKLNGRFEDRSGAAPVDRNRYWPPIVVTGEEIECEVERLAASPRPDHGRRESLVVHPYAAPNALGMAPGIQVKLSVLKPGEKTAAVRQNSTEANFCNRGAVLTVVSGRRTASERYDVSNHPSYS